VNAWSSVSGPAAACCLVWPAACRHHMHTRAQVIDIDYVNEAMKRMEKGDVKFRFVIDINKSLVA
jgi:cinnamyl-alcohol dehydrogenase